MSNPDASPIPSDVELKQAIKSRGPVVCGIATKGWDAYRKFDWNCKPNPDWESDFPGGIYTGRPSSTLKWDSITHEVVIVGWNDEEGVWLIKNSWGNCWGDGGFMKLKYQTDLVGFAASWVLVAPPKSVSPNLDRHLRSIDKPDRAREF
jgi:hypothetical protein